jgi:hypothetical protein
MTGFARNTAMTLEQLSLLSQIISAIAILGSLVFLALQIRGNTRELRSQSYFNGLTHGQRPFELMIQDPSLTRIVNLGYVSPDALDGDERERFRLHTFMLFNAWEYFFYQLNDGSIPRQLFLGTDAHMRKLLATKPGLEAFWIEYRHAYEEPFLSYVSGIFAQPPVP